MGRRLRCWGYSGDGTSIETRLDKPRSVVRARCRADGIRRSAGRRSRRPRHQLDRELHEAIAAALPAPMELGFRFHRGRPIVARRRAGPTRARDPVPGAVANRDGSVDRLRSGSAGRLVLPWAGRVADGAFARRTTRAPDLGDHAATDPRPRRARGPSPRAPGGGRGLARLATRPLPEARGTAPPPCRSPQPDGHRARGHRAPLGIGARRLARLGSRL